MYKHRLTEVEERLVRELLSNQTEAAFLSAADISQRAGVHQASAVRLAKKLGFKGYPQLRSSLQQEIVRASEPAERIQRRLASIENDDVLTALIGSETSALMQITQHVSQEMLDEAAQTLKSVRRIFLFARGHATSLVELMDRRLRRLGLETVPIAAEGRDLAEGILSLQNNDAVLSFAFHKTPPGLVPLFEHANKVGAVTVLIGDVIGPLVRPQPTILLAAPRGAEEEFQTLLVPMTLCNALVLTLARQDNTRSIQALEKLTELLERFEGNNAG